MIGEELTAIIESLLSFRERTGRPEQLRELACIIGNLQALRARAFGRVLVDPARMTMELERKEAGR